MHHAALPLSHAVSWGAGATFINHHSLYGGRGSGLTLMGFFFQKVSHARRVLHLVCVCRLSLMRAVALLHAHTRSFSSFPGDFFTAAFQCPHRVGRVGTLGDGGKWVCGLDRVARQKKCVIYSFGLSISTFSMPLGFDRMLTSLLV